ncbi:MAG: cytochrome b/b6 domain-containing protein [Nitrospirota bacterium]
MTRTRNTATYLRRLGPLRITEHWLNAAVFVVLVVTGLSQKFHDATTSQWLIEVLGGIDSVRIIHRVTGMGLIALTTVHILIAVYGVVVRRWQPTMIIHKKDFADVVDNLRYYLGLTNHAALCDRYDYKQKFEYWGVLIGSLLMAATGLSLWFPTLVVRFLPGELIPIAKALHTNEALLALLVIVVWHIYNAVFSPEVFPIDTTIFTGKISRERMLHEHPIELARIEAKSVRELLGEHENVSMAADEEARNPPQD